MKVCSTQVLAPAGPWIRERPSTDPASNRAPEPSCPRDPSGHAVPVRRARSIDELSETVAGHDTVLTADAPLHLALNRRLDGARLGNAAATPKAYATRGFEADDKRELFHHVVEATGLAFKEAATRLDLALSAWEATGRREGLLEWPRYDVPAAREVLRALEDADSAHAARQHAAPVAGDVAVIGLEDFTALDRRVLPQPYHEPPFPEDGPLDRIDPFADDTVQLPDLKILPSRAGLVRAVESVVTPANAHRIGIVLDPTDALRPLVEATLEARSIPYQREDDLAENPGLRAVLRALRLALSRDRLAGRDVRGLLAALGRPCSPHADQRRLSAIDGADTRRLAEALERVPGAPLGDAIDAIEDLAADEDDTAGALGRFRDQLEALGALEEPVDRDLVDALSFYLDTYEVRQARRRQGVLVTSALQNAYVDRSLVLHLGLDSGWTRPIPGYPWVDRDEEDARDRARLERLLQTGQRSVHLVQDTRQGDPVPPCLTLHELVDERFETFGDLAEAGRATRHAPPQRAPPDTAGFDRDPVDVEPREVDTLSASTLDRLAYCPRDWYMDQLVEPVAREHFARGTALHDFAEVYAHHPDAVDVDDPDQLDALVEVALGQVASLTTPEERAPLATTLRVGLQNVAAWLDANPPTGDPPAAYGDPPDDHPAASGHNPFAEHLGVSLERGRTERWFDDADVGVHGLVDLVHGSTRLVDWKSSPSPDSLPKTIRKARVDGEDPPRLQPAAYLAHLRAHAPDAELACTFVHVLANAGDVLRGEAEVEDLERRVAYRPRSFHDWAASPAAYEALTQAGDDRKRVLHALGPSTYARILEEHDLPAFEDKDAVEEHPVVEALADAARREIGNDYKYIDKGARDAMRKLVSFRRRALFEEDLDAFEAFVDETRASLTDWLRTRFPADCEDIGETRHPDLILRRPGPSPSTHGGKER